MDTQSTFVTIQEIQFEVNFIYHKGYKGSLEEPAEPAYFELLELKTTKSEDIINFICEETMQEVESMLEEEGRERMLEYQISKYEDMRNGT